MLASFREDRATEVASWATSVAEALAWCSHDGHPVPADTVAGWGEASGCEAFVLMDGPDLVGYGELWVEHDESEVELARQPFDYVWMQAAGPDATVRS